MQKARYTAIKEFTVIKPMNDLEHVGEKLKLSLFGEYCPGRSLRGYQLEKLITNPKHYRVSKIIQKGIEIEFKEKP